MFVLDVDEFRGIAEAAKEMDDCTVTDMGKGYFKIESPTQLVFNRRALKLKPALWYGMFTAGMNGEIAEFGREEVRLINTNR
jgi:hypothetical protein